MKKPYGFLWMIGLLILASLACQTVTQGISLNITRVTGTGPVVEETILVDEFENIRLEGEGDVYVEYGISPQVVVSAQRNLHEYLKAEIEGDTLVIGYRASVNITTSEQIRFLVTAPEGLKTLTIAGQGSFSAPELEGETVSLTIGGSGSIDVAGVQAKKLNTAIAGSGYIHVLEGTTDEVIVTIAGSGNIFLAEVQAASAEVSIPGSGDVEVWVSEKVHATILGNGKVYYHGDPPDVQSRVLGSGEIIHQGTK
jgi:hypothetical protein